MNNKKEHKTTKSVFFKEKNCPEAAYRGLLRQVNIVNRKIRISSPSFSRKLPSLLF
jgi:hypothetical protein